ncbi:hypothetical protein HO173_010421 [Letharia columbiana]|uniref:Uncharacterized protein n=1 Tax=Letharia columbiana TaxID=112416 RepID=A0A8H6FMK2_9LECA|nr:uncharacterized protein HO173_010421 [Letharia columbiana]KAF6231278.1 hypothetical protein HO173_010421 [Letharia columbiana]
MSQFSEKELQLMAAMVKNFEGSITAFVNWDQAALDSGYQDSRNAKVMWGRLAKKLATAPAAPAADGDDDNAGEGSTALTATPTKASKKRKAAGTPRADSTPAKARRSTKKAKSSGGLVDQLNAKNEAAAANVNPEGRSSEAETLIEQ